MICEICLKEIVIRHHIQTLFKRQTHHICERCLAKYPLIIRHSVFPIEDGLVHWTSMVKTYDDISPLAHMSMMKPFYLTYMTYHQKCIFLHFDYLSSTILTILDSMKLGDIYLLTLHENILEEENEYDI